MENPNSLAQVDSRSMGVKLIVVCGLAVVMTLPAFFVGGLIAERTQRAEKVVQEISSHVGGQQTFLGPTLAIPYEAPPALAGGPANQGMYVIFPARGAATVRTVTEQRRRSLFQVPVFQADLKFDATFDLDAVPAGFPQGAALDWSRAAVVVGVSDPRGALTDAFLTADGKTSTLIPMDLSIGGDNHHTGKLAFFGVRLTGIEEGHAQWNVTSALRFSGAQRIAVLAYAKTTHVFAQGDWASPGFDGGFLPITRTVSGKGFSAEWSVPFLARGVRAEGTADSITGLDAAALGVSFIEMADPYQSVSRSLKYVLLFLGMLFLCYFVFEVTSGKRVHPAQYILVGMAQIVFYLLLLSLAERIGFDLGFVLAGAGTVALLSSNAAWVFSDRLQGIRALVIFSMLYVSIYWLLRLEDNALLVGSIASFLVLAAAMYLTRHIDWYGSSAEEQVSPMMPGGAA